MDGLSGNQVLQNAITGQGGAVAQGENATAVGKRGVSVGGSVYGPVVTGDTQPSLPRYFHLRVIDPENDEPVNQMEPGKQYQAVVWIDTSPNSNHSVIPIQDSLSLQLRVQLRVQEADMGQYITIPNPQILLRAEQSQDFEHRFDLSTSPRLPHGQATLALEYWPEDKRYRKEIAVSQQLHLAGLVDLELCNATHINPDMDRPEHTAIIYVNYAEDAEQIKLTCWGHYGNRKIITMPFPPPGVKLADFIEKQKDPLEVLGEISTFSENTANIPIQSPNGQGHKPTTILGWLTTVYNRFQNDLQLAIVDHTDTEIPWEMLKLKKGGLEGFLGSLIPVVRWLLLPQGIGHRELNIKPNQCVGKISAYLDEASLPDAAGERQHLSHFDTDFYEDVETFTNSLSHLQPEIGLVYLGCHGVFTPHDIDAVAYGSQNNAGGRLIPLRLEAILSGREFAHRPVFFVNACHSGRVIRREIGFHGLPIVLLKHIAESYVGTLGPVGSTYANEIGRYILDAIRNSAEGESLAELLRRLREQAARQLKADMDSRANQLRFIYTFMYVYYGNPLLKLRLHPAPEPEGGDSD